MTDRLTDEEQEAFGAMIHRGKVEARQHVGHRASDEIAALRAEIEQLTREQSARRWNIDRDGETLRICRGDHEKSDRCEWETWVPLARAEEAEAERDAAMDNATLMNDAASRYLRRAEQAEAQFKEPETRNYHAEHVEEITQLKRKLALAIGAMRWIDEQSRDLASARMHARSAVAAIDSDA